MRWGAGAGRGKVLWSFILKKKKRKKETENVFKVQDPKPNKI